MSRNDMNEPMDHALSDDDLDGVVGGAGYVITATKQSTYGDGVMEPGKSYEKFSGGSSSSSMKVGAKDWDELQTKLGQLEARGYTCTYSEKQ